MSFSANDSTRGSRSGFRLAVDQLEDRCHPGSLAGLAEPGLGSISPPSAAPARQLDGDSQRVEAPAQSSVGERPTVPVAEESSVSQQQPARIDPSDSSPRSELDDAPVGAAPSAFRAAPAQTTDDQTAADAVATPPQSSRPTANAADTAAPSATGATAADTNARAPLSAAAAPVEAERTPSTIYFMIGDRVWFDANVNGEQDSGESGVYNVKVELLSGNSVIDTTRTNSRGNYQFHGFEYPETGEAYGPVFRDQTYQVRFVAPDGYDFTERAKARVPSDLNSDADEVTGLSGPVKPVQFDSTQGEPYDPPVDLPVDAGLIYVSPVNLTADNNADGVINSIDDSLENDTTGRLVLENADDDDPTGDGIFTADRDQVGPVVGENDLAEFRLSVPEALNPNFNGWQVQLTTGSGSMSDIAVWGDSYKGDEIALGSTFVIGQDAVPTSVFVEGLQQAAVQLVLLLQNPQGQVKRQNAANVRVFGMELDVNNNQSVTDAVDGFADYRPGYEGNTPKLSSGAYNATTFTPQQMGIVFGNLGTNAGVSSVELLGGGASGRRVSQIPGYSGNTTATGTGATDDDFATGNFHVAATYSWLDLVCYDYGGTAEYGFVVKDGTGAARYTSPGLQQIVRDTEQTQNGRGDGIQDGWEGEQVQAFHALHGGSTAPADVLGFFQGNQVVAASDEPADADGGGPQVAHKTKGDSLTPFQEYRGFILDGGGFDGAGANGHNGGHKRLSPVYKELLLEVDAMAGTPAVPNQAQLTGVLETVARGYSDATKGAGIRVYWVMDEVTATHEAFANDAAEKVWASIHSNGQLGEFVHLIFADTDWRRYYGVTKPYASDSGGSFAFTTTIQSDAPAANYSTWLAWTTAHEVGHTIIHTAGVPGWTTGHIDDPDEDKVVGGPGDRKYLMVSGAISLRTDIVFSNPSRRQIDLLHKYSVEP